MENTTTTTTGETNEVAPTTSPAPGLVVDDENGTENKSLLIHTNEAAYVKSDNTAAAATTTTTTMTLVTNLSDNFKHHLDKAMADMKEQNQRDFLSILNVLQQESTKRTAMEQRLHSQLLLQNEYMVAMELKLLRLEAKVERREAAIRQQQQQQQQYQQQQQQQQRSSNPSNHQYASSTIRLPTTFTTIDEIPRNSLGSTSNNSTTAVAAEEETPPNMAVFSSGASLASGVTAGSFLADDNEDVDDDRVADDDDDNHSVEHRSDNDETADSGNPIIQEVDTDHNRHHESEQSTPTVGSRPHVAVGINGNLESILLNPMIGETQLAGMMSVRATRGQDTDGNSSLATSVTNSTFNSTVVTATTRGDVSTINVRRILPEEHSELDISTPSRRGRSSLAEDMNSREEPRSRSQSPLTVNTHASDTMSMASASTVGTSIRSSVAVAPRTAFGRSRAVSANTLASSVAPSESRPLADRVVSFTPDLTSFSAPPFSVEATDSITMPDELDNFSEVADNFANSARVWREEYEARLDALHKRWSNE